MKTFLSQLKSSRLFSDSFSLSSANLVASALNYLLLVCSANYLLPQQFGIVGAAVSVLTLLTMVANIFHLNLTAEIANLKSKDHAEGLAFHRSKQLLYFCIPLIVLVLIFVDKLANITNSDRSSIVFLTFSAWALIQSSIGNGLTSGLQQLSRQALLGVASSIVKLASGLVLIFLGLGASGPIAAYGISYLIIAFGSFNFKKIQQQNASYPREEFKSQTKISIKNSIGTFCIYSLLVIPFVSDQLLIQHLQPSIGGSYAALAILGKLIFFLSAPILSVIYTHACAAKSAEQKQKIFRSGLIGILIISLGFLIVWALLGNLIGKILIPAHYYNVLPCVEAFCLGITAYCISYLLSLSAIIEKRYILSVWLIPAVALQIILFYFNSNSIEASVNNQLLVYFLQLLFIAIFYNRNKLTRTY